MLAAIMALCMVACDIDTLIDGMESVADVIDNNEEKVELSRGTIEGDVYTNEFLSFQFTKPESWVYSTDEEIAAITNIGAEKLLGENFKDALESNPSIYDMMVIDSITRCNINVGYENLSKTLSTNITVEQYVEALKAQLAGASEMTVTFPENFETAKLGETEFTKVECTTDVQGVSMKQVYYLKKVDGYMCFVIVTVTSGYTVEQIEAMFK